MLTIFKEIKKRPLEFLILFSGFVFSVILFFLFSFNPVFQKRIIYGIISFYFFWSIYFHYKRGDLHTSIIIEYLLLALFAIILIITTVL